MAVEDLNTPTPDLQTPELGAKMTGKFKKESIDSFEMRAQSTQFGGISQKVERDHITPSLKMRSSHRNSDININTQFDRTSLRLTNNKRPI